MRHIIQIALATLASIAVLFGVSATLLPPSNDLAWVETLFMGKLWRLKQAGDGPRIIIVGGSEAHYTVSAELIERETGIQTINLGTHAGLGWQAHLHIANDHVRPGDIVIYSANYFAINQSAPSALITQYARRNDMGYVWQQPMAVWPQFVGVNMADTVLRGMVNASARRASAANAVTLNDNGDETRNVLVDGQSPFPPVTRQVDLLRLPDNETSVFPQLAYYSAHWQRQDIRTFVAWMAPRDRPEFSTPAQQNIAKAVAALGDAWKFTQLIGPIEVRLADEELSDGPQHANSLGRERYTRLLIERLKPHLDSLRQPSNTGG